MQRALLRGHTLAQRCWQQWGGSARGFAAEMAPGGRDIDAFSPAKQRLQRVLILALPASMVGVLAYGFLVPDDSPVLGTADTPHQVPLRGETIVNWSATHEARPHAYYQPETEEDVEAIVAQAHAAKRRLRVVGGALSPNGIGLSGEGMMGMGLLDRIVKVDAHKQQVTVQAGCRVQQVADALKPHGLTLQNYASIREQQIGGFTQVSAHGTGATIPPVDDQVVSMKLVTPGQGTLTLSKHDNPDLFRLARVGLGCLGVVTELTLQCVPAHQLVERTFVATAAEIRKNHAKWLGGNRHLRYMWLPYTDSVVVVQCNPAETLPARTVAAAAAHAGEQPEDDRSAPLRQLLLGKVPGLQADAVAGLTAFELRDQLLALDPLDRGWVAAVNQAEAEFWKRSAGWRVGSSDEILGFDCGGQQWVLEVAFPCGPLKTVTSSWTRNHRDLQYMEDLLTEIQSADVPAHAPIEQRWTSSTSSPMSPAHDPRPDSVHSWVGVIMYLPTEVAEARDAITSSFRAYTRLVQQRLMPKYGASWHWAKIEPPEDPVERAAMRAALAARFPLAEFRAARARLDPHGVLGNELVDSLL